MVRGFDFRERMPLGHQHHPIPLVAGQRDQFGIICQRLGGDADIDIALGRQFGDLARVALMQDNLDLGIARGEFAQHLGQNIAGLRVRGGNGQCSGILAAELVGDTLQVGKLAQCTTRSRDHDDACGRKRGQALALPHEYRQAEFILQLPDLLADAGLRGKQRLGCNGNVQTVVDNRAKVFDLL